MSSNRRKDYRLEKLQGSDLYLTPADARAGAAMDASFRKLTGRMRGEPQTLRHKGRSITVPQAALGVARFTFADLCVAPLGPLDYQRIAHSFHTLMIEEIPVLGPEQRNEARRLITLIDVLYDNGVGADRLGRGGAAGALCRRHRRRELRPHRHRGSWRCARTPISPSGIDAAAMPPSRAKGRPPCACRRAELPVTKGGSGAWPRSLRRQIEEREPWLATGLH